ncbi:hypothetical protein ACFWH4_33475, partial [Streptomyces sp. NPDC127091]|uniref:hypothetical protein n=1 Tax=Streptomyces sp. NPDC127091 TaxID=3347134 RepID=UPI00365D5A74
GLSTAHPVSMFEADARTMLPAWRRPTGPANARRSTAGRNRTPLGAATALGRSGGTAMLAGRVG